MRLRDSRMRSIQPRLRLLTVARVVILFDELFRVKVFLSLGVRIRPYHIEADVNGKHTII